MRTHDQLRIESEKWRQEVIDNNWHYIEGKFPIWALLLCVAFVLGVSYALVGSMHP